MANKSFAEELKEIESKSIDDTVSMLHEKIKDILRTAARGCTKELIIDIPALVPFEMSQLMKNKVVLRLMDLLSADKLYAIGYFLSCYIKIRM